MLYFVPEKRYSFQIPLYMVINTRVHPYKPFRSYRTPTWVEMTPDRKGKISPYIIFKVSDCQFKKGEYELPFKNVKNTILFWT